MADPGIIVFLQCDIAMQRCSGYLCDKSLRERAGAFADLAPEPAIRSIAMTCGGCCGLATHRKLLDLIKLAKKDGVEKNAIRVHLASCVALDNFHGPQCPHLAYIRNLIHRLGLETADCTYLSANSQRLRNVGVYEK